MNRGAFLKRTAALLLAPTAAKAIDFGALAEAQHNYHYATIVRTPLGHGSYFRAHDLIRSEMTGEQMRVLRVVEDRIWLGRGVAA